MSFTLVDEEPETTRLPEQEGRLFYVLWGFMCALASKRLSGSPREVVNWNEIDFGENDLKSRMYVSDFMLASFESLLKTLQEPPTITIKKLCRQLFSRYLPTTRNPRDTLSKSHIEQIKLWSTTRIEGTFWHIGYCAEGGVFCYLGGSEDEERCFIVKGLASTFTEFLASYSNEGKKSDDGVCLESVLLPWGNSIIFYGIFCPPSYTPKAHMDLSARLQGVFARCSERGRVHSSIDSSMTILLPRGAGGDDHSFFAPRNRALPSTPGATPLFTWYSIWSPNSSLAIPLGDVSETLMQDPPIEGFKFTFTERLEIFDQDQCVLCPSGKPFRICCKQVHERRVAKAKGIPDVVLYCFDATAGSDTNPYLPPPAKATQLSLCDFYAVEFLMDSRASLNDFCERLKELRLFYYSGEDFFHYWGAFLVLKNSTGIQPMGSLEVSPAELKFKCHCNSGQRMVTLLKDVCMVISQPPALSLTVAGTSTSVLSGKYDKSYGKAELEGIKAFLATFTTTSPFPIQHVVDKTLHSDRLSCCFCGKGGSDDQPLLVCSGCKRVRYCSKDCQKQHWKMHKVTCTGSKLTQRK